MKYRSEIDGLRALAVVPVILFHAGLELFSGGFVGVDVFFVISGYLITTILIEDIDKKRFSIATFYERRARRILPALFFVMLACIPFAWMWMIPSQLNEFAQSLIAVCLFASNILFWLNSDYFAPAAEENPLLHTWSLAVEEQYYILFPIFLLVAWRFGRNRVFWMITAMAVLSLILSELGWRKDASANFYLAPTRAWELFSGSIAALIIQKKGLRSNNALAFLGLAAIVFSIFAYDKSIPFPSLYTLIPVGGAVLIVLFADKNTYAARLLSTNAFVGIGLISYSTYLWHQPLFAYTRLYVDGNPSISIMLVMSALSIFIGYLSWKFIETPFRNKKRFSSTSVAICAPICLLLIAGLGSYFLFNSVSIEKKFYAKLTEEKKVFYNEMLGEAIRHKEWRQDKCFLTSKSDSFNFFDIDQCLNLSTSKPNVLLLGDSHAAQWYPGIVETFPNINILQATSSGCSPLVGVHGEKRCKDLMDYMYHTFIPKTPLDAIIIAGRWKDGDIHQAISDTLQTVKSNTKKIYLVGNVIEYEEALPLILLRDNSSEYSNQFVKSERFSISKKLEEIAVEEGVHFISPIDLVCPGGEGTCAATTPNGIPTAFDYGHLSIDASKFLVNKAKNTAGFLTNLDEI